MSSNLTFVIMLVVVAIVVLIAHVNPNAFAFDFDKCADGCDVTGILEQPPIPGDQCTLYYSEFGGYYKHGIYNTDGICQTN